MTTKAANGSSIVDDDNFILEPREVDVLCGRGGMSNHHPGNEWYRRLIRSNRPLYRACPKHTKLLVAKAIVQAVQQQNGRFLERDKKNGYFYKVTYKRAVDKTSQGLRERERDGCGSSSNSDSGSHKGRKKKKDNDDDDDDDNNYESDDFDDEFEEEYNGEVPDGFRGTRDSFGRLEPPNLTALASVAIENTKTAELKAKSRTTANGIRSSQINAPSTSFSSKKAELNNFSKNIRHAEETEAYANTVTKRQKLEDSHQQYNSRSTMQQVSQIPMTSLESTESTVSFIPLPPSIQVRESSMFRGLLQHTKLLPGVTSTLIDQSNTGMFPWSGIGSDNIINSNRLLGSTGGMAEQLQQHQRMQQQGSLLFQQPLQKFSNNQQISQASTNLNSRRNQDATNNFRQLQNGIQDPKQIVNVNAAESKLRKNDGSSSAPALTRLTTQVSDWLKNSFWPLNSSGSTDLQDEDIDSKHRKSNEAEAPPSRQEAVLQAQKVAASIPPPLPKQKQQQAKGRKKQANFDQIILPQAQQQELHKRLEFITNRPQQHPSHNDKLSFLAQHQYQSNLQQGQRLLTYELHQSPQQQHHFALSAVQQNELQDHEFAVPKTVNKRKNSASLPQLPYFSGRSESTFSLFSTFSVKNLEEDQEEPMAMNASNLKTNGGTNGYSQSFSLSPKFVSGSNDDDSDDPLMANADDTGTLPRTELEQSVSTTLLKLAGATPSLLLSGLTSFFDRGGPARTSSSESKGSLLDDTSDHRMPPPPMPTNGFGGPMLPPFGSMLRNANGGSSTGPKKSKASLLDDYEESPMEARLREVSWRTRT